MVKNNMMYAVLLMSVFTVLSSYGAGNQRGIRRGILGSLASMESSSSTSSGLGQSEDEDSEMTTKESDSSSGNGDTSILNIDRTNTSNKKEKKSCLTDEDWYLIKGLVTTFAGIGTKKFAERYLPYKSYRIKGITLLNRDIAHGMAFATVISFANQYKKSTVDGRIVTKKDKAKEIGAHAIGAFAGGVTKEMYLNWCTTGSVKESHNKRQPTFSERFCAFWIGNTVHNFVRKVARNAICTGKKEDIGFGDLFNFRFAVNVADGVWSVE